MKKWKKLLIIAGIIIVLCGGALLTWKVIIPMVNYNKAVSLMEQGEYREAANAFLAMDGYSDSKEKAKECYIDLFGKEAYEEMTSVKAGDIITFGSYEQDNDTENGQEPIEWVVLQRKGINVLVVSKEALDTQPMNDSYVKMTWENCSLRTWLNSDFLNAAFTDEEKERIQVTEVKAEENPDYIVQPGNDTEDQIFILNVQQLDKFMKTEESRRCTATAYAIAQGAFIAEEDGNCWWWTRSPGYVEYRFASVYNNGDLYSAGYNVDNTIVSVRPAMWVSLG